MYNLLILALALSLNRTVTASSAYDYNLTAQLVCDGIIERTEPSRLVVTTAGGELPRSEKEFSIDRGPFSYNLLPGEDNFLDYRWTAQSFKAPCVRIAGNAVLKDDSVVPDGWSIRLWASRGGSEPRLVGEMSGTGHIGKEKNVRILSDPNKNISHIRSKSRAFSFEIPVAPDEFDHFRVEFSMPGVSLWVIKTVEFSRDGGFKENTGNRRYKSYYARGIDVLPSRTFSSAWMSRDGAPQWIKVDLGKPRKFSSLTFHWIHQPGKGSIEVSDNGASWRHLADLPSGAERTYTVDAGAKARFVRVDMEGADESGHFCLSELEVNGKDSDKEKPSDWHLSRGSLVTERGESISSRDFDDSSWLPAVVPGTVLYSYIAAGAVPDPNIADNNQQISESYFNSDFWYRGRMRSPSIVPGRRYLLEFDGINFKAEVFFNGRRLGDIAGAFRKKAFDVTELLSENNTVAVHIIPGSNPGATKEKNALSPGFNGGLTGADSPSFQASVGWDWIPTVRGRESGIWNDVRIRQAGACDVRHPLVSSKVSSDGRASISVCADAVNLTGERLEGTLYGAIADIEFQQKISLGPDETRTICFDPERFPQLKDRKIALWWPNGMGEPALHRSWFSFVPEGGTLSGGRDIEYLAGIREFSYQDSMSDLKMYINGKRFIPKGGNWGFSEVNLRYRDKEYDKAVSLHKEMNFNMIRNWVGQTGDEEFYEACDKYGIVVWQDFWLANPADGPDPDDEAVFMDNADNYLRRIRLHSCIGLYCGRNEGYPPKSLDEALRRAVETLHPGLLYIPSSADDGVSGHGPYRAVNPDFYFATPAKKFHTERGMPAVPSISTLREMFTSEHLWPVNDVWGQHDFTRTGAQGDTTFVNMVRAGFGEKAMASAEAFAYYSQWIEYDGYRAMYEANNVDRKGLLIWMSHSCWPSLAWQTYDYWFRKNGAFYGAQKACETLHVQFNPVTRTAQIINSSPSAAEGLSVSVSLTGTDGKETFRRKADGLSAPIDSATDAVDLSGLPDGQYVMTLTLADKKGKTISENIYLKNFRQGVNTGVYTGFDDKIIKNLLKSIGARP